MAADRCELHARGLTPADVRLRRDKHVLAVPPGENGWLVHVERFLYAREEHARDMLRAEAGR